MEGTYELRQGSSPAGTVCVRRQGLYYQFSCRCRLAGTQMYRLMVTCGDKTEDLGLCVPMDGQFGLEKRIPCKRLGEGVPEFRLLPRLEKSRGQFVAVYPDEPFSYMARLKDAFLAYQAGQMGIVLKQEKDG